MNTYALSFTVNEIEKNFDVEAESFKRGLNEIQLQNPLFDEPSFLKNGYMIAKVPETWHETIISSIKSYILNALNVNGINPENFQLDQYHTYVNDEIHQKVVDSFRGGMDGFNGIPIEQLNIPISDIDSFINETIKSNRPVSIHVLKLGLSIKKFWIRIIRPNTNDNNPPHKDSHLVRNRNMVISFYPIVGCNEKSSLPVIPGSHLEPESEYIISSSPSFVDKKEFNVPAIVHRNKGLNLMTPNPKEGEILIFTPELIHGGGVNLNTDTTRISLEMRYFN
jgi:hypothetical protein